MGTYPPRECGIATFNQDLLNSSQRFLGSSVVCKVVAMNFSSLDTYIYPQEVAWEIDQNNKKEHISLAKELNQNPRISGVIIQHEYGIYGGKDGKNILDFLDVYKKPVVVTLHTVLPNPTNHMRQVTAKIINKANNLVVLTNSSKSILETIYPKSIGKVKVIPHGIHPTTFTSTANAKNKLKLTPHIVLSTFGLLSRDKGIEYVLQALPQVVKKHPTTKYLILGGTHPLVRRAEGETYRNELAALVTKLKLKQHVKFYDQYLSLKDLFEFLKATDIYISTSINPHQAVSGTLSYALGAGRAVVSTSFAQAKEIITKGSGSLVPMKDPVAYSQILNQLLSDKNTLSRMHHKAYEVTRPMLWSNVAAQYSSLFTQNTLPPINLKHLHTMTDEFGLFQFAHLDKPDKTFGYTLDDNARALIVCSLLSSTTTQNIDHLTTTYLHFIQKCQQTDGSFINYIDHQHKTATNQNQDEDIEESTARALWALAEIISNPLIKPQLIALAKTNLIRALPHAKHTSHLRAAAFTIKALSLLLLPLPELKNELLLQIKIKADFLVQKFNKNSATSWQWFEDYLSYNNAILPESLIIAGDITKSKIYTNTGTLTLSFLINKTFSSNMYLPIGHSDWYKKGGKRSSFDQQPEDPASMILALVTAYQITQDKKYRSLIDICFSWFLGNNSLRLPLYNYQNGGCYDGLHPDRINLNQGAESQVSYLLSRLAIERIRPQ